MLINIITPVLIEPDLTAIKKSILRSLHGSSWEIRWIQVFDRSDFPNPEFIVQLTDPRIEIVAFLKSGTDGDRGIRQINRGLGLIKEGFVLVLQDTNVMHPNLLRRLEILVKQNPDKKAFVFSQTRYDMENLIAEPSRVAPCQIDGGQVVMSTGLIGNLRIDPSKYSLADYHFVKDLYDQDHSRWMFVDELLTYHGYLKYHAPPP